MNKTVVLYLNDGGINIAQIPLIFSFSPPQSAISIGRSSRLHPVSYRADVFAGQSTLMYPRRFCVSPCFFFPAVPSIFCFSIRWEVSGRTAAVLWCATLSICSNKFFSLIVSYVSRSYNTVVKISLFNDMSTFVDYLMPKPSL